MLRQAAAWSAAIVIGALLGAASAWGALAFGRVGATETYGLWSHSSLAGSSAADPYTRAAVAFEGLLALSAREALYFTLSRDENGRPLDETCVYELSAPPLAARWWSVTLYAADDYLVRNDDHAPSVDATRTLAAPGGGWRARISPVRGEAANWLSSRNAGRGYSLTLRVYNPEQRFEPSAESLPQLTTLSCAGREP
jgi:hypothetical protein